MSNGDTGRAGREDLEARVGELAETLDRLERELEGRGRPRGLLRFTREVTIPAVILVLRTNIEALRVLQRALAFADDDGGRLRSRAEEAGRSALDGLDDALREVSDALSGRPVDSEARDLLDRARDLQAEIEADLDEGEPGPTGTEGVDVDVDRELRSIKDEVRGEDDTGDEGED
jgi:hypothetical protein